MKDGTVLYELVNYKVIKCEDSYSVVNTVTGIEEESTNKLFEAVQYCKIYDLYLRESYTWEPPGFDKASTKETARKAGTLN